MASRREQLEGLLLCRVGDHQLAFAATQVSSIAAWNVNDAPLPHARLAYALPAVAGKALLDAQWSLVVDGLEISAEPLAVLPVPAMLSGSVGGALHGFVAWSGALLPLLGFSAFSRYLAGLRA